MRTNINNHYINDLEKKLLRQRLEILRLKNELQAQALRVLDDDLGEMRDYQRDMVKLENLNLIGQMAASIAHEVRNPMTSIRGFLQLLRSQNRYREDQEVMDLMIDELDRINNIITAFLSLAQNNNNLKLHNLNENINNLLPLLKADAMKNDILIKTELHHVEEIICDEAEIRQLLLNLVRNGIEAMSDGGTLIIRTLMENYEVNLIIQDSGPGIHPDILAKIGTPFFTTKEKGTGLGLAVSYRIAKRHNARIDINTSAGGTVFKIAFPLT